MDTAPKHTERLLPTAGLPLQGLHILVTAPTDASTRELAQQLTDWGANVDTIPLIQTEPIPFGRPAAEDFDWVFFTSKNAVSAFYQNADADLKRLLIAVVGPATQRALEPFGIQASFISARHNGLEAARAFVDSQAWPQALRVLWPCGNRAHPDLPQTLRKAGIHVVPLPVYETTLRGWPELSQAEQQKLSHTPYNVVIFTSSSCVHAYSQLIADQPNLGSLEAIHANPDKGSEIPSPLSQSSSTLFACMGLKTANSTLCELQADALRIIQPRNSTLPALADAIRVAFEGSAQRETSCSAKD